MAKAPSRSNAKPKTVLTDASVQAYLDAIEDPARRADCVTLCALMATASKQTPRMWGSSIVGFGNYHYRYESGHEGDACEVGFSSRKGDISVYLSAGSPDRDTLLAKLGKHKMGKACLYVKRMSDIDPAILTQLVQGSIAETRRRYP